MRVFRSAYPRLQQVSTLRNFSVITQPTLDTQFPGIPPLKPASAQPKPQTKVSTLSNGIRVATEETYGPVATAGVFINAGSRYETHDNNGISHLLEHMAFKSTMNRSPLRIMRDIEAIGGTVGAQSGRDCIMFSGESLRDDIEVIVATLAETALQPKLTPWDLDDQRQVVSYELETLQENAQQIVTELVHAAAYGESSSLGRSLWCPTRNLNKISTDDLVSFVEKHFTKANMVVTAAGVNHESFVELAEKYFTQKPSYDQTDGATTPPACEYQGGRKLVEAESEFTHVAVGFNPGSWHSDDLLDICTMHFLLGGGGSFSAGGPGKGMYSRLYLNVLNKFGFVDSAIAFNTLYDNNGLFGIYGSGDPRMAGELVNVLCDELLSLKNTTLTEEEVQRAKNQTKSSLLMKLEERQILFEDIGRQMLVFGKRMNPEDLAARVDAVTPESIKKCATKMLKTKPTIAAFGDVSGIPSYDEVVKKFN